MEVNTEKMNNVRSKIFAMTTGRAEPPLSPLVEKLSDVKHCAHSLRLAVFWQMFPYRNLVKWRQ